MHTEKDLLNKYGRDTGMSVPEGYFESLQKKIIADLPEAPVPERQLHVEMTRWQRIKPYVYLAAMFVGIWLMMNIFHRVSSLAGFDMNNVPESVSLAMATIGDDMSDFSSDTDYQLESDISTSYNNIEDFSKDFDYNFKPEYAALEVPAQSNQQLTIEI